jgi:Bifunctional DNA primase/polymerase, N-terminal/Primase C terminal 1 (PriCT-1)
MVSISPGDNLAVRAGRLPSTPQEVELDAGTGPEPSLLMAAVDLGGVGFRVFPVWAPIDGQCPCKQPSCGSPGKHPHIGGYRTRATTDHKQIEAWWTEWPDANIGILCGDGLVPIDIDGDDGEKWLEGRELPETLTATSGRGRHLYYAGTAPTRIALGPHVDIIGHGYVVAPPSLHRSGQRYEWINDPLTTLRAALPEWVYAEIAAKTEAQPAPSRRRTPARPPQDEAQDEAVYREGERNDLLYHLASQYRRYLGLDQEVLEAVLTFTNAQRCQPPLPEAEVSEIARSAVTCPHQAADWATLRDLHLLPTYLAVLNALLAEANVRGECTISYDVLADKASVSMSTAERAVIELRRRGIIDWSNRPFLSNRYTIKDCSSWKSEEQTK